MANGLKSVAQRDSTTTPVQALLMMNGSFSLGRATNWRIGVIQQAEDCDAAMNYAFLVTWGRVPTSDELAGRT